MLMGRRKEGEEEKGCDERNHNFACICDWLDMSFGYHILFLAKEETYRIEMTFYVSLICSPVLTRHKKFYL